VTIVTVILSQAVFLQAEGRERQQMNNSRQWILAAASFLALSLWVGTASGDELDASSSSLDELELNVTEEMGSGALQSVTTGDSSAAMTANSDPDAVIQGNTIGDNSTTGDVAAYSANSGGINVNFANSGNNVVMQNSMAVNIYLGPQQ
jgi:hypothetical protein